MRERDFIVSSTPMVKILAGTKLNTVDPNSRFKKYKSKTKYLVLKQDQLIAECTIDEMIEMFNRSWEHLKTYLNKNKKFDGIYYIKSKVKLNK